MKPFHRHQARRFALQGLYQWMLSGNDIVSIESTMMVSSTMQKEAKKIDIPFFKELLHQVPGRLDELDATFSPHLDRAFEELDPVELVLLRMGTYELTHRLDIPYRVTINEAVELAKVFGGEDGHKYVNSILDKVIASLNRPDYKSKTATKTQAD